MECSSHSTLRASFHLLKTPLWWNVELLLVTSEFGLIYGQVGEEIPL